MYLACISIYSLLIMLTAIKHPSAISHILKDP